MFISAVNADILTMRIDSFFIHSASSVHIKKLKKGFLCVCCKPAGFGVVVLVIEVSGH